MEMTSHCAMIIIYVTDEQYSLAPSYLMSTLWMAAVGTLERKLRRLHSVVAGRRVELSVRVVEKCGCAFCGER